MAMSALKHYERSGMSRGEALHGRLVKAPGEPGPMRVLGSLWSPERRLMLKLGPPDQPEPEPPLKEGAVIREDGPLRITRASDYQARPASGYVPANECVMVREGRTA